MKGGGGWLSTAARETVPAGSERQSQTLQAERAVCLHFFFSVPCFASCICTVLWKEAFQSPSSFGWPWVHILGVPGRCTNPSQGGETGPSSKTPLRSCLPNMGVVRDMVCPVEDVSDVSALLQAAGKLSQLPPTRETFYRGWGNWGRVEVVTHSHLQAVLWRGQSPAPGCTDHRRRGAALMPPCREEGRLAERGRRKEQPVAWDDSATMWGGVRFRLCQTQPFAMCLPGPG